LTQPDNEELQPYYKRMIYALAHECGHVHDLATKVRSLPETWLKVRLSRHDGALFEVAEACWSEYIASRLSAMLSPRELTGEYENTFCEQIEKGLPAIRGYLRQYRMHGDVSRVLAECSYVVKKIVVYASYLFGQLHGIETSFADAAPKAKEMLERHPAVQSLVLRIELVLQALHQNYGDWPSFDVFEPLKKIALALFAEVGLELQERDDNGMYVNIPITPETTPGLAEQLEYLNRRMADV